MDLSIIVDQNKETWYPKSLKCITFDFRKNNLISLKSNKVKNKCESLATPHLRVMKNNPFYFQCMLRVEFYR